MHTETRKMAFHPHGRSISLPSRLHPTSLRLESDLNTLRVLEESPPSSSSSVQSRIVSLAGLYASVNDLLLIPSTAHALRRYDQGKLVEDSLEDSVGFLSVCGITRDLVSSLKDHVRDLQSALRRSNGGSGPGSSLAAYSRSRKHAKKEIAKCIRDLKEMETKSCHFTPLLDVDLKLAGVVRVLREVVAVTVSVFRSLLVFLSVPLTKRSSRWCLISKMVSGGGRVTKKGSYGEVLNEVGSVDMAVQGKEGLQALQGRLRMLDSGIMGIECALEELFRCLVQKRVSLLNILSH